MGTPDFAGAALAAIVAAGHDVVCVYSQPPRPAGRGKRPLSSPVLRRAEALGLALRSPVLLKEPAAQAEFAGLKADAAVVAAYGLILPAAILAAPRLGCVNIHASLLPRWRGAAPIQRAILAGDQETGITVMQMDEGLDTGAMLTRRAIAIGDDDAGALHDRLATLGGELIVQALDGLAAGALAATPQPEAGVTYAKKLTRDEEAIDWTRSATDIVRQVRAFAPRPGAHFELLGEAWKLLAGSVGERAGEPGTVLDDRLTVACGQASVAMERVQRPGSKPMAVADVLRGHPVPAGTVLG
ncbi:MAG: methionyl-tRNA formyltransferase [Alphaproteobacteria bacterium]